MKFKLPLMLLILALSLTVAFAGNEKGTKDASSKMSCCTDGKKAAEKCDMTKGSCDMDKAKMDKANCPVDANGKCTMEGSKASMKKTSSKVKVSKTTGGGTK